MPAPTDDAEPKPERQQCGRCKGARVYQGRTCEACGGSGYGPAPNEPEHEDPPPELHAKHLPPADD